MRKHSHPICIHCNSQTTIGRTYSNIYNDKYRHIRCRHTTIKQFLATGVIFVHCMKSKDSIGDWLTIGLSRELKETFFHDE